jgi:hypothetical protein
MTTSTCVPCEKILFCEDGPLSTTSNILGILTFMSALIISIQVYVNSIRHADRQMLELESTFESRVHEVRSLSRKIELRADAVDGRLAQRLQTVMPRVQIYLDELSDLNGKLHSRRRGRRGRFWARAKFVLVQDIIAQGLEKAGKALEDLRGVANDVFEE